MIRRYTKWLLGLLGRALRILPHFIARYTNWLHGKWPAGGVERSPKIEADGTTELEGVRVVGDLTGVPLLKFSADTGAKAVQAIREESDFKPGAGQDAGIYDLAIVGAGVAGLSAAVEAKKAGLNFVLYEADEAFSTIHNFPRKKLIYTYPTEMRQAGELRFESEVKEDLLKELKAQQAAHGIETTRAKVDNLTRESGTITLNFTAGESAKAQRVIVAIGRTGNFRKLNVPGEDLDKVANRLLDPEAHAGEKVLVVGGGDSALEAAVSLAEADAQVTLSYRKKEFSRPKPENVERLKALEAQGKLSLRMGTQVQAIHEDHVVLCAEDNEDCKVPNDQVYTLIGREPPLDFFRKSGVPVSGDWSVKSWLGLIGFFALMVFLYHWKAYKPLLGIEGTNLWQIFAVKNWFPFNIPVFGGEGGLVRTTLSAAQSDPGFTFALLYTVVIVVFGVRRIRRRRTAYVTRQTSTLMAFQVIPLFVLPYLVFPWMYHNGLFADGGFGEWFGMTFLSDGQGGEPNQFWRAFGFILAWPLFIYNIFTEAPIWGWIVLGFIQTFVIIPLIVWRWGKGAYCGWICSCGAMAETLGDRHRHKMPHGPFWNKLNMVGQGILALAFILLILRIIGWATPWEGFDRAVAGWVDGNDLLSYKVLIDLWLAGAIGYGLYFHFSGRVWCRFACPLAALMHIYARFSQFRIFPEKKKCISCNLCTTVCHQGIDVMNFANKGLPMEDPECVRCSACVQTCPTGVLQFGRYDSRGAIVFDKLSASPVLEREAAASTPVDRLLDESRTS
ncbi:MAG: NAD(P)-binding domain-containing protein [Verrucomicrobia bacterium]|jgi:thioredoxin reductase/Fe-S-cluster-containing hydrogenase component 2|nr:NAD(P)-binding domain-containing protein [Verrucomicrobiota bacterium]